MYFLTFFQLFSTAETENTAELFEICNKYREENEAKPLKRNKRLDKAALLHAKYCAQNKTLSHIQEHEGMALLYTGERIRNCGYKVNEWREIILCTDSDKAQDALNKWVSDEKERKKLIDELDEAGYAAAKGSDGKTYWVAIYATLSINPYEKNETTDDNTSDIDDDYINQPPEYDPQNNASSDKIVQPNDKDDNEQKTSEVDEEASFLPKDWENPYAKNPLKLDRSKSATRSNLKKMLDRKKRRPSGRF